MKAVLGFAMLAGIAAGASADVVAYDHMTGQANTTWSIPSGGGSAASTGNRFMGTALTLGAGSTTITGFDTTLINNSGAAINFQAGWQVSFNYWIWNTWNPAATTGPAFSNLAGNGSVAFGFNAATTLASNSFFFFSQNSAVGTLPPVAGSAGGIAINPTTVTSAGTIGITQNWTINRNDGLGFVALGGLTEVLTVGGTAPTVGTNDFGGANLGYYRSAAAENNGNFVGNSARSAGANSGVMFRVYTTPTPGSLALLGLGGLVAGRRRR